jgi:hypothetical protein
VGCRSVITSLNYDRIRRLVHGVLAGDRGALSRAITLGLFFSTLIFNSTDDASIHPSTHSSIHSSTFSMPKDCPSCCMMLEDPFIHMNVSHFSFVVVARVIMHVIA